METVTIILNGAAVSGYPGMTVLDLAKEAGVSIPTLCHDPLLVSSGACRLCLVEEEHSGALLAACVTPIRAGMTINTRSPRVIERRKTIINLMLASHPDSCLVCDKGNACRLRRIAAELGIGTPGFQRLPQAAVIMEVNPFIERDLSKCIMCGKCIRTDQELVVEGAIDYFNRGNAAKPATYTDGPLEKSECTFCGMCVALCPTGAIAEKGKTYHGTTTTAVETVCPFCSCGCNISLEVKDNHIIQVRPDENRPDHKALCSRGAYGLDFVHSPDRLVAPLIKVNGVLQTTSWEQALSRIASEFSSLKEKYGADSLAVFGSSKCTNEENYLLQRFARGVLSTNNIDNGSRLYGAPARIGLGWSTGFPGTTSSLISLEQSKVILVIGADPTVSAPAVGYAIKRAVRSRGARLILVDPRQTRLSSFASLWLRPKLKTDAALLNGLAKIIVDENLFDEDSTTRRTDNFTALTTSLQRFNPSYVAKQTGITVDNIRAAARLFAMMKPASIVFGNGIMQQANGTNNVLALANLAMLTGSVGRGGGIIALPRENNAQGACDMGSLPDFLPGYKLVGDEEARRTFSSRWGFSLPVTEGATALEMMKRGANGQIKGMFILGENPVASFPEPSLVKKALSSIDLLVVSDMFLTETARLATVVLPAASFAEKEGTFTNFEGKAGKLHQAVQPPGEALPDWKIIINMAKQMGHPMPYSSVNQVWDEITEIMPDYRKDDDDIDKEFAELESKYSGSRRLYRGAFPAGFGRFVPAEYNAPEDQNDGFPLSLMVGSIMHCFGSGTRSSRAPRLKKFYPASWVEVSAADVRTLGFHEGEMVKIVSPHGKVEAAVKINETLSQGMLYLPVSFPGTQAGNLFDTAADPKSGTPAFKTCAVRLERTD